jgi:hypothetical protein
MTAAASETKGVGTILVADDDPEILTLDQPPAGQSAATPSSRPRTACRTLAEARSEACRISSSST